LRASYIKSISWKLQQAGNKLEAALGVSYKLGAGSHMSWTDVRLSAGPAAAHKLELDKLHNL